jgi:hypothetical protein
MEPSRRQPIIQPKGTAGRECHRRFVLASARLLEKAHRQPCRSELISAEWRFNRNRELFARQPTSRRPVDSVLLEVGVHGATYGGIEVCGAKAFK